jgi:hypothetical protein
MFSQHHALENINSVFSFFPMTFNKTEYFNVMKDELCLMINIFEKEKNYTTKFVKARGKL